MFCPKCGKEIPNQAAFCPKCGASINASGSQPQPTPAQPAAPGKSSGLPGAAAPAQKKAVMTLLLILVLNLILAGMWKAHTLVLREIDGTYAMPVSIAEGTETGGIEQLFIFTCAFAVVAPLISGVFLGRHVLKRDGKIGIPYLPWLNLIWVAGFHMLVFCMMNGEMDGDRILPDDAECVFSALGWLYNLLCVVLAAALVYLTALHFKASKERKAHLNP